MYGWNSLRVEVQFISSSSLSSANGYTVWCEHFSVEHSVWTFRPFCRQYNTRYNCHGSRFMQSLPMVEMSSDDWHNCWGTIDIGSSLPLCTVLHGTRAQSERPVHRGVKTLSHTDSYSTVHATDNSCIHCAGGVRLTVWMLPVLPRVALRHTVEVSRY